MNAWPDTDGRTIARYLGQLRLRCSTSPIYYRQALRTFQEVVIRDQRTPGQLGREVLETWLREYAMHWPMATLLHRARIVNRFLDFLVGEALIVSNPIADLRAEYHAKSDKAIVRSLLAPDPDQALEALRQFPPFGSVLGDLMRNHIALMQARGYRYQTQARWFSGGSIASCRRIRSWRESRYRSCCSTGQPRDQPPTMPPNAKSSLVPCAKPNTILIPEPN
jgi:integrase/recombinase XerD